MGFFSKTEEEKTKEKKENQLLVEKKTKEALVRLGVDFDSYSDEEIKKKIKNDISFIDMTFPLNIMSEFLTNFGMTSFQRIEFMKLQTLVSQNWVLIRQNELIIRSLEKINKNISKK